MITRQFRHGTAIATALRQQGGNAGRQNDVYERVPQEARQDKGFRVDGLSNNGTGMQVIVRKPTFEKLAGSIAVAFVALAGVTPALASAEWQDLEAVKQAAVDFMTARIGRKGGNTSVEPGFLDPRLRLPQCGIPLEPYLNRGTRVASATTVGVRCRGARPWKVYVPVTVVSTATVVVANQHLPKGSLLTPESLRVEKRDVTRDREGYYTSIEAAAGQRVTRPIVEGRIVSPGMLAAENVVRRGQSVTLVVSAGGLKINMAGKALIDGAIGQRIKVENLSSGRVVEGVVRSREHVEVLVARGQTFFPAKAKGSAPLADTQLSNNDR